MAAPPAGFEQLSQSSRRALEYAWAAAMLRTEPPADAEVNAFDLLIGMLLAHPGTSEAEQTFRRFGLVAGQALPADYPSVTADELQQRLAEQPADAEPPLDPDAYEIVRQAVELNSSNGAGSVAADNVTEMRYLWVALLRTTTPASNAIGELLNGRGVNARELAVQSEDWLRGASREDYASVLQRFSATPVDIVNYKADQSSRRVAQSADSSRIDDFVGISAEVDAFAYLLASRTLEPPLAVGLFGEWGSGKSFFLESIKRRIEQLTQSPSVRDQEQRNTPFWKHIVQVDFNAWHYIEGDLWSSLVDNLFRQLSVASDGRSDDFVAERQKYLLEQLEKKAAGVTLLAGQQDGLKRSLANYEEALRLLKEKNREAEQQLEARKVEQVQAALARQSGAEVKQALEDVQLGSVDAPLTLGEAATSLREARAELDRGWSLLQPFRKQPRLLVALLACLIGAPLIAWLVSQYSSSAVAVVVGAAPIVVAGIRALQVATGWLRQRRRALEAAQAAVEADIQRQQRQLREQVEAAQQVVDATRNAVSAAQQKHDEAIKDLASVHAKLLETPPAVLNEFLRARLDAGEYRKRLGLPAIIRDDFKDLAELIGHQNTYLLDPSPGNKEKLGKDAGGAEILEPDDPRILNRIILYIDDLDRCSDSKVIEVLQAVHLLLAFPLFVVVVAVDARWLAHALQTRYPALAGGARSSAERPARPEDYLEKIFQIPFWVESLSERGRAAIVRGLLGDHVREDAAAVARDRQNGHVALGPDELEVLTRMIAPRTAPPRIDVTALQVTREELQFLEGLTPLLGQTPRSVKRFVNLYQLIKILRRGRGAPDAAPADEHVAAFLLAVAESLPATFKKLDGDMPPTLGDVLGGVPDLPADELNVLGAWLNAQPLAWRTVEASRVADLAREVKRFLFRVDEAASADGSTSLQPQLVHVIQDR